MPFPKSDEDVLVKLDWCDLFAVAEYYNSYNSEWTPSQSTNPIDGEESYVLSGNVMAWYSIPKNITQLLKNPKDKINREDEEVFVQLKSGSFAVAIYSEDRWTPGKGTHPSYLDIYPVLDSEVIGWMTIEDFLMHAEKHEIE